jgi:hypothetical protein
MNKPRGGPFAPGNKLGRGRLKGSRNKAQSPGQDLLDEYALHLVRKCISMAMQGDHNALRICMDRISPARKNACIRKADISGPQGGPAEISLAEVIRKRIRRREGAESNGEKLKETRTPVELVPAA